MRDRFRRRRKSAGQELNITPNDRHGLYTAYLFYRHHQLRPRNRRDIERPSAQSAVVEDRTSLLIGVDRDDEIHIEGDRVDLRMIRTRIARFLAANPEGAVVVVADKSSAVGAVVDVLDECRRAGASNLSIAARIPKP